MLDMANDSGSFRTAADLETDGWQLDGNIFRKGDVEYLPLYEAKMTTLYDHRLGSIVGSDDVADLSGIPAQATTLEEHQDPRHQALPRYWVPASAVQERIERIAWPHRFFINFRDVARSTDVRSAIHAVLPRVGVGHKAPLILPFAAGPGEQALLLANLNSFVFDYFVRQKLGGASLSYFIVKQLPAFPPSHYQQSCPWNQSQTLADWIKPRVLELTYTAHDLKPFAEDLGYSGEPFIWNDDRRFQLRCELDAAFFHLYGISEADAGYILDTFPIVKAKDEEKYGSYRTKDTILRLYRQYAQPGLTAPQFDMLRAMACVAAFVEVYGRRIGMNVLETGLVLMVNDGLRTSYINNKPLPGRRAGRRHSTLLDWMPLAIQQLLATQAMQVDPNSPEGLPLYTVGPSPFGLTDLPSFKTKATEALQVMKQIGDEQAARTVVEEYTDDPAQLIPV
jgi:hypothetical protein